MTKETEMYDDDLRGALRTMVEREPFEPIEPGPVLRRGRRGVSRRRWAAVGAAGMAGAAVAAATTMLPGPAGSGPVQLDPAAVPMTGLPAAGRGDAALRSVTEQEMLRRCRMQWSAVEGREVGQVRWAGGVRTSGGDLYGRAAGSDQLGRWLFLPGTVEAVKDGAGREYSCMVPGDSVPTAADLAEDARGVVPADDASTLRRCSTMFWHDLRGWRVLARQVEPRVGASIAAMSPSGKYVLNCFVSGPELRRDVMGGTWHKSKISGVQRPPTSIKHYDLRTPVGQYILDPAVQTCARTNVPCVGWFFFDTGRMPLDVVRLEARTKDGRTTEIPVRDGWFAAAFGSRSTSASVAGGGTLTAFDSAGRQVGSVQFFPMPR